MWEIEVDGQRYTINRAVAEDVQAIAVLLADAVLAQLTSDKSRADAHRFYGSAIGYCAG